jgi:hypothetical protein
LQQCDASISGVGGVCNLNPAAPYQAPPTQYQYQYRQPFNPMAMPPPPRGGM